MDWYHLSLLSSLFLGFYEIAKKVSLKDNAVAPVLFFNVLTQCVCYLPVVISQRLLQMSAPATWMTIEPLTRDQHLLLATKSLIAGSSWIFASFAIKHLPMSIASPIRATSPVATILIAVAFLNERPTMAQWFGVIIIILSMYAFSLVGRKEGIRFHRDRWVWLMVVATMLGACSSLYDKYLLQTRNFSTATVQAWFAIYLVPMMIPISSIWYLRQRKQSRFEWRWSIPAIAMLLLISDFLYFYAIEQPGALMAVISPLRRTSVIVSFVAGVLIYGEKNWRQKAICIATLLIGVCVISLLGD